MDSRKLCDSCGRPLATAGHYVVRIDVFADPSLPATTSEELAEADFAAEMAVLMEQMKHMTAEELQDQVHRRFEFKVCRACQLRFLANPLGKPRVVREGKN